MTSPAPITPTTVAQKLLLELLRDGATHPIDEIRRLTVKLGVEWRDAIRAKHQSPHRIVSVPNDSGVTIGWRMEEPPPPDPPDVRDAPQQTKNPGNPGDKPKTKSALAQEMIVRKAQRMVRDLFELTLEQRSDAPPCPTCRRGMPRSDETRLKAILALLDRALPKVMIGDGASQGPLIVFPAGTRIAVAAGPGSDRLAPVPDVETGLPPVEAVRADRLLDETAETADPNFPEGELA